MNQVTTLGCISKKISDTYAVQVFCINTWDHCCLIYHKKKLLIKYHYLEQRVIRSIQWCKKKSFRIFDIAMSKKHRLYFLLCQDWFIYFLNFEFQVVNKVQLECKQFTNLLYLDHLSSFIMVQFNSVCQFEISMKEKFVINKYQELEGSLEWNRQCKQIDYFYLLYNSQQVSIYNLKTLTHIGIIKVSLTISDIYYINELLYAGDVYGTLWCYDINGILQYFHEHAHDGQIVSMTIYKDELFTIGNDLNLKVWKLSNLTFCQSYPIYQQQIQYFKFINYSKYFIQSVDQLFICELNHILQAYHQHNSSISAMSDLCIAFKNHVYYSNLTRKILFAPNSVSQVLQIIDSPTEKDTYYLHLSHQVLAKWVDNQYQNEYQFSKIRTVNGDKINQDITYVAFLQMKPPLYDVELTIDNTDVNRLNKLLDQKQIQQFITLGCSKGAVLFIPFTNYTVIYTRINYNKDTITDILEFNNILIIKSKDNIINFINILTNKPQLIKTIHLSKLGPIYITKLNKFCIAQSNELYTFNNSLIAYETNTGHESDIFQITSNSKYIISNSIQQVKVWNDIGICIHTINFHVQIDYIYYLENDLIISVNGGLCNLAIPEDDELDIDERDYKKISIDSLIQEQKLTQIAMQKNQQKEIINNNIQNQQVIIKKEIKKKQQFLSDIQEYSPTKQDIPSTLKLPGIRFQKRDSIQVNLETPKQKIKYISTINKSENISKSNINTSFDYSIQHTVDSSCILPAIPKQKEDSSLLNKYLTKRNRYGGPRNRREWTLEKKILNNILSLI